MKTLTHLEIKTIFGANGDEFVPFSRRPPLSLSTDIVNKSDFHAPGIAAGLLLLTFGFNTAATATLKPAIPLWGIPVTLSFGLALCGTVLLLGQGVDWLQPDF